MYKRCLHDGECPTDGTNEMVCEHVYPFLELPYSRHCLPLLKLGEQCWNDVQCNQKNSEVRCMAHYNQTYPMYTCKCKDGLMMKNRPPSYGLRSFESKCIENHCDYTKVHWASCPSGYKCMENNRCKAGPIMFLDHH